MDRKKILVVGDALLDIYHFGEVNRISPEAPVPVFLKTGKEIYASGGAANVAVNIAAIGIDTEFCTIIGEDEGGKKLLEHLSLNGVGIKYTVVSSERITSSKMRYIGQGNQQILRVDEEKNFNIPFLWIKKELQEIQKDISEYGVFVLSDYLKGFLTNDITQKLINLANASNIPVLVDVKDLNLKKYRNATILKPNRKELCALTGKLTNTKEQAVKAAISLCKQASCSYVLATLGAEGMILTDNNDLIQEVKSSAREVYDVTGAGDTSIAYLAAEIIKGARLEEAVEIANYAAGVQVSKVGTSIIYPDEVFTLMQQDKKLKLEKPQNFCEKNLGALKKIKESGKKIVFTKGCFDILHIGHISYLKAAKELGDILVIGVNSDQSVKRLKGEDRPINCLTDRISLLTALKFVDYVIPFDEDSPENLIAEILPDVLVKGGDYLPENIVGADLVRKSGGEVKVLPFVKGKSTTLMINKIQKG